MTRTGIYTLLILCLCGCATSPRQPQKFWYNPSLDNQAAQARFVIDRGECQAIAANSVPYVPPPSPPSLFNNPSVSTSQIQLNSTSGQTYYGQITSQSMSGGLNGPIAGALAGQQYSLAYEQYQQAEQAKTNLFFSCMYQRGWEERASTAAFSSSEDRTSRPLGASCWTSSQCIGDLYCQSGKCSPGGTGIAPRSVLDARPNSLPVGAACAFTSQCAGALVCKNDACS